MTPSDNPAWFATFLPVELSNLLAVYSPILLSGFNEKEYVNQPAEDKGGAEADVA